MRKKNNNKKDNTMKHTTKFKITNTKNVQVEILPSYTPKYSERHTIKSHFKNRYFVGGTKPTARISNVYHNAYANYKTNEVVNHITKYKKVEKEAA